LNRGEYVQLLGEKAVVRRLLAETPEEEVIDRASLRARLKRLEDALAQATPDEREPARVRLTFRGRPVVGSDGIFAEFGTKAVSSYAESVTAMAASLSGPLPSTGRIPNREQHQLLITNTVPGSFGFELEEHLPNQLSFGEGSAVAQALERIQSLLLGTLGTDDELADSAAEADRRALDKVRSFLGVLADHEAVCAVQFGESVVRLAGVVQVRACMERLSQENLREESEELRGELQGVLPRARLFEFRLADSSQFIRGKIAPSIGDPDLLNRELHQPTRIRVTVTRVGNKHPRYVLREVLRGV
jgi:hypothetical protein